MKKKILVISQNFHPEMGSAANRIEGICYYLSEYSDVTVLTTEPQYPYKTIYNKKNCRLNNDGNYKVERVKTRSDNFEENFFMRFILYIEVLYLFLTWVKREKVIYDIILVTTPPLSIPIVGLYAKKRFKAQLIVDIRDLWPETLTVFKGSWSKIIRKLMYMIEKSIYLNADKIIVNSEGFIPYIQSIVKKKKIYFLSNSLKNYEFSYSLRDKMKKKITVVYTGNVGIAQDLEPFFFLAKSFEMNPNIQFLIIGYGRNYQKIKKKIKVENLKNIIVNPPVPRQEIFKVLKNCEVAYIGLKDFSVFETVIPGKIIDYMGAGLPIIGVCSGYSKKVIENSGAGVIFKGNEKKDMKKQLDKWIKDEEIRSCYGENAKRYASEKFNWEINRILLKEIINEEIE